MTSKPPAGTGKDKRPTLTEADISSRRSTRRSPLVDSLGVSGPATTRARRVSSRNDPDRARSPDKGDKGGKAAKPGYDRD